MSYTNKKRENEVKISGASIFVDISALVVPISP